MVFGINMISGLVEEQDEIINSESWSLSSLNRKPGCSVANAYNIKPGPSVIFILSVSVGKYRNYGILTLWNMPMEDVQSKIHENASHLIL